MECFQISRVFAVWHWFEFLAIDFIFSRATMITTSWNASKCAQRDHFWLVSAAAKRRHFYFSPFSYGPLWLRCYGAIKSEENLAIYINISSNYCFLPQITLSLNCLATEHQKNSFYPGLRIKKHHIWCNNSLTCQSINNNDSVTRAFLTMVIVISTFGRFQRCQMTP